MKENYPLLKILLLSFSNDGHHKIEKYQAIGDILMVAQASSLYAIANKR